MKILSFTSNHADRCIDHYHDAVNKHPYFCDALYPKWMSLDERKERIITSLRSIRNSIKNCAKKRTLVWDELLNCEVYEVHEALANGNTASAIEECYDAISVLLRVIDVLEGRQKLGRAKEVEE